MHLYVFGTFIGGGGLFCKKFTILLSLRVKIGDGADVVWKRRRTTFLFVDSSCVLK
jgi:hypothetical protein